MKIRKYIVFLTFLTCLTPIQGQMHTRFVDQPLDLTPDELIDALVDKGLQQEDRYELSGRIAGLDIWRPAQMDAETLWSPDVGVNGSFPSFCSLVCRF